MTSFTIEIMETLINKGELFHRQLELAASLDYESKSPV